ncbi:hypothetical protein EA724_13445 [Acinetobacter baumannii]|nr:hypothetical protein EA724_13445 [Acinetobacter baumannii]
MFIEIGEFLNLRLKQMGIQHLFGVPGDFNLSYLEQVEADPQLEFIGNCLCTRQISQNPYPIRVLPS